MRKEGSNILITVDEWMQAGLSYDLYKNDKKRGYLQTATRGGNGRCVEIIWQSIAKDNRRAAIRGYYGDPERITRVSELEQYIREDAAAKYFFENYELQSGEHLGLRNYAKAVEYYNNAIILTAAGAMCRFIRVNRKSKGICAGNVWQTVTNAVNELPRKKYPHTLPACDRRLRERYATFAADGLQSLVHKSFCNQRTRKVYEPLENLILSIYCMSNKPYGTWVHEDYMMFIGGMLDIVDMRSGELIDRQNFFDEKKGEYISISEATCWNYINNPKNRALVDSLRSTNHEYISTVRPHYHRSAPKWSLSKISLDDRDLPRRLHDGNRVKAYYAYDVASGVLIGAAYSLKKNANLFIDCVRDMFRFIDEHGYGMPMEVEVEHHLVKEFKNDLMCAGTVFPFVRFCAPGNSQEKHAEQFNGQKKYGYEKRYQDGIGRFYAKLEANRTGGERVYDGETDKYVIKEKTYSFEQLVADDRVSIERYNNGLHRDQKMYKDMTRLEVLHNRRNPELMKVDRVLLARYIGDCTTTSIQRNMYCQVQYKKYMLPTPTVLARLAPNNYTVQAYYMPAAAIETVYIYQNDVFIAACSEVVKYNTSQAEATEADTVAMTVQAKYIAQFDKLIKDGKETLAPVKTIANLPQYNNIEAEVIIPKQIAAPENMEMIPVLSNDYSEDYWSARALNDF